MKRNLLMLFAFILSCAMSFAAPQEEDLTTNPVTPPNSLVTEEYTFKAFFVSDGDPVNVNRSIQVGFDGNDVYISGISYFLNENSWIKGKLNAEKTAVSFQSPQFYGAYLSYYNLYFIANIYSENDSIDIYPTTIEIPFDVESGNFYVPSTFVFLEGNQPVNEDSSYGYYVNISITKGAPVKPDVVVPPEGLVADEYSASYINYDDIPTTGAMKVGFYGTDVYIQGINNYLPEAWIKGTLNGDTITFAGDQYLGCYDDRYDMYLQESDMKLVYDSVAGTLTSTGRIYTYTGSQYADYYKNLVLKKVIEIAGVPATPSIRGIEETEQSNVVIYDVPTVDVNGNGMLTSKLSYQFFIDDENTPMEFTKEYYINLTENMTVLPYGFTDGYDFVSNYFYLNMPHDTWTRIGIQSIYTGGGQTNKSEISWFTLPVKEYPIEVPANLQTEIYVFSSNAKRASSNGDNEYPDYRLQVNVGFDNDDVYIQGLCDELPEQWVKATKNAEGKYVIPANQYIGELYFFGNAFPFYWTAIDEQNNLVDAVLDYNEAAGTFTTSQTLAVNLDKNSLDYLMLFNEVAITKFVEVEATPSDPVINAFSLSSVEGLTYLDADIPTVGTNSESMNENKLFYTVWYEKEGTVSPYTFTAALYTKDFTEDIVEVPYVHDVYDVRKGAELVYFEDPVEELQTWTKVGLQSIYYGAGVCHKSNVVWKAIEQQGINDIKADTKTVVYDLQGRRVTAPGKGLYIVNGKKVVLK